MKALGDHSRTLERIRIGTRVLAEGPFGTFTAEERRREKLLLIAGGIGIAPVRALLEGLRGDVVVLYRVVHARELFLRDEVRELRTTCCGRSAASTSRRVRDEEVPDRAVADVFAWLRHVDATFSTHKTDSEISRINRGELGETDASAEVRGVLARCEELRIETGGCFDVRAASPHSLDPSAPG